MGTDSAPELASMISENGPEAEPEADVAGGVAPHTGAGEGDLAPARRAPSEGERRPRERSSQADTEWPEQIRLSARQPGRLAVPCDLEMKVPARRMQRNGNCRTNHPVQ